MKWYISTRSRLSLALAAASVSSCALWAVGAIRNGSTTFAYLMWNLLLAWIPFVLMVWLTYILRNKLWSSWRALAVTAAFVLFLPNTFYVTTDIIHLQEMPRVDLLFDVIILSSFIVNAFVLGIICVYMFHNELQKRIGAYKSWVIIAGLLLLSSFAIYIGRDLRWNTWDIIVNPASILFEVSDRLLAPGQHPEVFWTTAGYFVFIVATYVVAWHIARMLRPPKSAL